MPRPLPPEMNRMAPDRAPTPFSAQDIAEGCKPGRRSVFRIVEEGAPTIDLRWEFIAGDDETAEYVVQPHDLEGRPLGPPAPATVPWTDLQAHASYPADQTAISVESVDLPAGAFECWKYTVDEGRIVSRAWFACDLPGPPVLKIDTVDGREVASMTLVDFAGARRNQISM